MKECDVFTLKENMENGDAQLVDVRESSEFAGGRVAGAKLMPLGEIVGRTSELELSKTIYLMCRTGRRSAEAQKKLQSKGIVDVVNVTGGFEAWKKEGLPFERDEKAPWSIERQVRFFAGIFVLTGILLSIFIHPYFLGLSGFVGFGLAFTALIDWCGMGLLLAKMPWNRRAI